MKEIKFLNSMIADIKSGRKTQTRRLVKSEMCQYEVGEIVNVFDENLNKVEIEITAIRKERLQDISEQDAVAEGIISDGEYDDRAGEENLFNCELCSGYRTYCQGSIDGAYESDCDKCDTAVKRFSQLWQSIYSNWDENPYVWVIELKRVS